MNKAIVKQGYDEAQNSLREKQVAEVKAIVLKTLERLEEVKSKIKELQEEKKILELDIDDLKAGRLDRIEERQAKDPKAAKVSVALIIKEIHHHETINPWYVPYRVMWPAPVFPLLEPTVYCGGSSISSTTTCTGGNGAAFTLTSSIAKDAAVGCYSVSGHTVNLR